VAVYIQLLHENLFKYQLMNQRLQVVLKYLAALFIFCIILQCVSLRRALY